MFFLVLSLPVLPQSPTAEREQQEPDQGEGPTTTRPISPPRFPPTFQSSANSVVLSLRSSCGRQIKRWCETAACRHGQSRSSCDNWSRASLIRRPYRASTAAMETWALSSQSQWISFRVRLRIFYSATTTSHSTGESRAKWWCPRWDQRGHGYRYRLLSCFIIDLYWFVFTLRDLVVTHPIKVKGLWPLSGNVSLAQLRQSSGGVKSSRRGVCRHVKQSVNVTSQNHKVVEAIMSKFSSKGGAKQLLPPLCGCKQLPDDPPKVEQNIMLNKIRGFGLDTNRKNTGSSFTQRLPICSCVGHHIFRIKSPLNCFIAPDLPKAVK